MTLRARRAELLLLLGAVAFVLLATEVALRVVGAGQPRPSGYAPVNTNRRAMRPRNAAGYRDLERAVARPPGVRRVVLLGDSFAWGASIEFEDALPQRLERGLNRRRSHERWEVVSLALPGMNTVDHAAQVAQEVFMYQPDVVLLAFVLNDSEDAAAAEARRAADWVEARQQAPRSPLDRSVLLRWVRTRVWATRENRRRVRGYLSMYADDAPGWVAARQSLDSIAGACRARGVPLVVAIFPLFGNPLDESYPFTPIHVRVADVAARAGARVVDLLPAYRGLRWDLLVVDGADDEHPNEIAHRIAASVVLREIDAVVPLPGASPATPPARAP